MNCTFREEVKIDDRTFPCADIESQCNRRGENSMAKLLKNSVSRLSRSVQGEILVAWKWIWNPLLVNKENHTTQLKSCDHMVVVLSS